MIPAIKMLERRRLRSGLSSFAYDPWTLLLHEQHEDNPPLNLDTSTRVEQEAFVQGEAAYHTSTVHERTHWLQYHGTTIGALLSLIRFVQGQTAHNFLRNLPKDVKKSVMTKRVRLGQSVIPLKTSGALDHTALANEPETANPVGKQIYHDCIGVSRFLFCATDMEPVNFDFSKAFAEIMGDAFLYMSSLGLGYYPGNDLARSIYRLQDSTVGAVRSMDGVRLTTEEIMETAATSNELIARVAIDSLVCREGIERIAYLFPIIHKLLNTSYGIAAKFFRSFVGISETQLMNSLSTLSVLCDLSLNPPVPPVYFSYEHRWQWADIYPPLRFARLASEIQRVGILQPFSDHEAILDFTRKLCDATRLPHPIDYPTAFGGWKRQIDFRKPHQENWSFNGGPLNHYDFILFCNCQIWRDRCRAWSLFSNYGESTCGNQSERFAPLVLALEREEYWYLKPLLYAINNTFQCSVDLEHNGNSILLSGAMEYFLYDLMLGHGGFDFSAYPQDFRQRLLVSLPEQIADACGA